MYELVQIVPPWLARWSLTEGWIGFAREELGLNVWLSFYAARGHAYAAAPGEEPQPLSAGAPAFTARQTTEPWTRGAAGAMIFSAASQYRVAVVWEMPKTTARCRGSGRAERFLQHAVAADPVEGDARAQQVPLEVGAGDRPGFQGGLLRDQYVAVGRGWPGSTSVLEPVDQGSIGELTDPPWSAPEGDAPIGQVEVVEGEQADGLVAGRLHCGESDDHSLGRGDRRLLDSVDFLLGHGHQKQARALGFEVCRGVGEDDSALVREPEEGAQRDDGVASPRSAQRVQGGGDVGSGDLTQVAAGCGPAMYQRLELAEVGANAFGMAGPCAFVPVE